MLEEPIRSLHDCIQCFLVDLCLYGFCRELNGKSFETRISSIESKDVRKVPFLGYIPLIGWLFTSETNSRTNTDLVIFITPTIVSD